MANTVTILSYANTFGDWIVTTNALARENNDFAANNYVKPAGTLYLNDPNLGLQVANVAVIAGQLQVQGTGSSAYIQNNLRVDQQVYFTNTTLGLTNTGQMNVGGIILALASGTGLAVSNSATVGNTFTVTGQSNLNGVTYVNNDLYVSGNTNISNTVQITGTTTVSNNLIVTGNTSVSQFVYVAKDVLANNVTSAYVSLANTLVANVATISPLVYSNRTYANTFTANVATISPSIYSNITYANTVTANAIVNTVTLNVTGTEYVDTVAANTLVSVPTLNVNTVINANTATEYINSVQANTISTKSLTLTTAVVTGTEYVDTIKANTNISVPTANVSSRLDANSAAGYFDTLQTNGQITVGGNFVINGSTVYNSNVFTLNAGSSIGLASEFDVNRGTTGANASIRWNESQTYWDIKDVSTGTYYQVLTTQQLNNTVTSNSTILGATANVANTLNNSIISANNYTNNVLTYATSAYNKANIANVLAQAAFDKANTESGIFNGTTGQATPTNGVITLLSTNGVTITGTSNTLTINTPQDLRSTGNPTFANVTLSSALTIGNGGTGATSRTQALTNLLPTGTTAGYVLTTGGAGNFYWAAGGGGGGGGATPGTTINSTRSYPTVNASQTVFTTPTYVPGTDQLRVYINGVRQFDADYTETSNTSVTLSNGTSAGDVVLFEVDGYVINPYYANNIAYTVNSNISTSANTIQLAIDGLASIVTANYALQSFAQAAYNQANTATTQTIPISQGGTGATSATQALTNLLPSGTTAGYVLTTGGSGSYYWAAAGSGGSSTSGTTIQSSRLEYTGNGSNTAFTAPTYIPGDSQVRLYIDGVRQFPEAYTETSNTVVTFNTAPPSGSKILVEVDGYINNPYFANTIAFTVNSNISSTANTIQLAIDGLTSKLTTYYANTALAVTFANTVTHSGITTALTPANTTSNTQIATTQFVNNLLNINVGSTSNVQHYSIGIGTAPSNLLGEIRAANNITAYYSSDISLKENVNDITNALDIVYQIGGKTFDWKDSYIQERGGEDGYFVQKSDFGVIAQDVQKVFPLAIRTRPDGLLAVDYEKLCALAFAAIKELKDEIEILKGNSK
jgi:hypothetical protein